MVEKFTSRVLKHTGIDEGGAFYHEFLNKHKEDFNNAVHHVQNAYDVSKKAAQGIYHDVAGGSIYTGAGLVSGGKIKMPIPIPRNHKEMYHAVLRAKPADWEAIRETASQFLGSNVSPMWSHMKHNVNAGLKTAAQNYEHIVRMPHQNAAARMLEAEASTGEGAGFFDAMQHAYTAAAPVLSKAAKYALANKEMIKNVVPYGHQIGMALDAGSKISNIIQKIYNTLEQIGGKGVKSKEGIIAILKTVLMEVIAEEYPHLRGTAESILGTIEQKGRPNHGN